MGAVDAAVQGQIREALRPLQDEVSRLRDELWRRECREANRLGITYDGSVELGRKIGDLLWQAPSGLDAVGIDIPFVPPTWWWRDQPQVGSWRRIEVRVR